MSVRAEAADTPEARALIAELDEYLDERYPPEQNFGLSVEALLDPQVVFLVARAGDEAVGCGAVSFREREYAEIKRMFVRPEWRGRGVARAVLSALEDEARRRGSRLILLETGVHQHEALCLYERAGYRRCALFGQYVGSPQSVCFEKTLDAPGRAPP